MVSCCAPITNVGTLIFEVELLAIGQLIGAAGSLVSRRCGMVGRGDKAPMVSVLNVDPDRINRVILHHQGRLHTWPILLLSAVYLIHAERQRLLPRAAKDDRRPDASR